VTYLDLINAVLIRLREDTITAAQVDTDPYWRFIGSAVNDAKDRVEDAWQWGALRGTDSLRLAQTQPDVVNSAVGLPNSADNHYIIKRIQTYSNPASATSTLVGTRSSLSWQNVGRMNQLYQNPSQPGTGRPSEFAVTGACSTDNGFPVTSEGDVKITLWPYPTDDTYWLEIDRVSHQATLTAATDILKVPSLPVYTLATALASRERGEVGGAPTSELFTIADRHLGDAIAQDSSFYANELDWWANTNENQTNVRFA